MRPLLLYRRTRKRTRVRFALLEADMQFWAIPLLMTVGAMLAVQAAANVQLSTAMRSPMGASTLQLAIGSVLLLIATAVVGTTAAFGHLWNVTPWHLLGGLGSAIYITAGILLFPRLGALTTVGLMITGQMLASLLLDTFGLLGLPTEPLQMASLVGVLAVLTGVTLIVRSQASGTDVSAVASQKATRTVGAPSRAAVGAVARWTASGSASMAGSAPSARAGAAAVLADPTDRDRLSWLLFAMLSGAVLPVQGAVNAWLRADLNAPITVATFSFLLATAAMGLALAVALSAARTPRPQLKPLRTVPWWGWLGGLAGAIYVTSMFLFIPRIGAAPTVALTVAGQQLVSVAVDQYGLLRLPRRRVNGRRLAGVAVLLAGVALLQLTR
ncbi:DMT family transporter [Micromonospora zamorensis]|uniref:DMT family transporter n=1 Tax=Micromonospora zamorensis TaxID=709883 RepID=UPI0036945CF5